jgi:hypothetical protein
MEKWVKFSVGIMILASIVLAGSIVVHRYIGEIEVHVYVSNQSEIDDPANITVRIDGEERFARPCDHENGHNWIRFDLDLSKGSHEIEASSGRGLEGSKEFSSAKELWIVVNYFYDGSGDGRFEISILHDPPLFM